MIRTTWRRSSAVVMRRRAGCSSALQLEEFPDFTKTGAQSSAGTRKWLRMPRHETVAIATRRCVRAE
jgi:hypothetical protein